MSAIHEHIRAVTEIIVAGGVIYAAFISRQNSKHLQKQDVKLTQLHEATNGMSERLQATAQKLGEAIGTAEEKERSKGE